jgi:hypothetical protein
MTDSSEQAWVLRDGEGNYYRVPVDALATWRVSESERATFEQQLGEQDVSGFSWSWGATQNNVAKPVLIGLLLPAVMPTDQRWTLPGV